MQPCVAAPGVVLWWVGWSSLDPGVSSSDRCSWSHQDLWGCVALLTLESAVELELTVLQQENRVVAKVCPQKLKLRKTPEDRSCGKVVPVAGAAQGCSVPSPQHRASSIAGVGAKVS